MPSRSSGGPQWLNPEAEGHRSLSLPRAPEPGSSPGRTGVRPVTAVSSVPTYRRYLTDAHCARHSAANRVAVVPGASLGEHTEVWTLWNGRHHRSSPTAPASAEAGTRRVRQSAVAPHRLHPARPLSKPATHAREARPPPTFPACPPSPGRPKPALLSLQTPALLVYHTLKPHYTLGYFQALPSAITVFSHFSARDAQALRSGGCTTGTTSSFVYYRASCTSWGRRRL